MGPPRPAACVGSRRCYNFTPNSQDHIPYNFLYLMTPPNLSEDPEGNVGAPFSRVRGSIRPASRVAVSPSRATTP
eukprot:1251230-Prymnesium_polylepis.1